MAHLPKYNEIVQSFGKVADFVTVYIAEAHPLDEWALLNHEKFSRLQHRTLDERLSSASVLKSEGILGDLVVESMDNAALGLYAAQPERLYIIQDGDIVYKGGMGPIGYRPEDIKVWLEKYASSKV